MYSIKLDLLANPTVIDDAIRFVIEHTIKSKDTTNAIVKQDNNKMENDNKQKKS